MAILSERRRRVFLIAVGLWTFVLLIVGVRMELQEAARAEEFARAHADMVCERGLWSKPDSKTAPDCWQQEYEKAGSPKGFWGRAGDLLESPYTWIIAAICIGVPSLLLLGALSGRRWAQAIVGMVFLYAAVVTHALIVVAIEVPVSLAPYRFDRLGDDYFTAEGTWIIEGSAQAFPLQTTKISCLRDRRECLHVRAQISQGSGAHLHVYYDRLDVQEWTTQGITYTTEAMCVSYVYSVDFSTKSVTGLRRMRSDPPRGLCLGIDKNELRLKLESGDKVVREQQRRAMPLLGRMALPLL